MAAPEVVRGIKPQMRGELPQSMQNKGIGRVQFRVDNTTPGGGRAEQPQQRSSTGNQTAEQQTPQTQKASEVPGSKGVPYNGLLGRGSHPVPLGPAAPPK